ncbi:MAG TPA: nucleotidyltransferase substrate binding protein [Candidatus Ozemobacteraceae bacterium]|nr:nucleotidyltransferase substrate binding protein [Candidatus Ozemobacteraceae bacterium]
MADLDIRWKQRLSHYQQALLQLTQAVELSRSRALSDLEKQGLIQAFEFTHELAWNVMKDYFVDQGNPNITGSRDAFREAFQKGLIQEGENWMNMIKSRNLASHTHNRKTAEELVQAILHTYHNLFRQFAETMQKLADARHS